ncbi:TonB [Flavobacteriales bacterium ALC-1]|nr:TonB [Flavobacteriales bacterium ALC-1]
MEYLIKASAVIILFYLCFSLFLKKETFFQHNRWFLLIGLMVAMIFPLIVIPIYISVEPIVIPETLSFAQATTPTNIVMTHAETAFDWSRFLPLIYGIGFIVFLIQFVLQFGSLVLLLVKNPKHKDELFTYVIIKNKISPFSFFKWIVYNPDTFDENELNLILTHEKVHAKQLHSIDLLLTQLACIIFWFNPLIWFYRKEVRQNLEYIADSKTQATSADEKEYQHLLLKTSVANHNISLSNNFYNSLIKERIVMLKKSRSNKKKQWRYLLMLPLLAGLLMSMNTKEIYVESEDPAIASNKVTSKANGKRTQKATLEPNTSTNEEVNIIEDKSSTYKKSGVNKKTKPSNSKKKASLINSKTIAMTNPEKPVSQPVFIRDISTAVITKNTTDAELEGIKENLKKEGLTIKFKGIKRNKSGEITAIKIDAKSKKSSSNYQTNSDDEAIKTIKIVFDSEKNSISIGNGHARHGENTFVFESEDGNHKILKSGSSSNTFIYSIDEEHEHDEEDEEHEHGSPKFIIKSNGKKGKIKKIKSSSSNVHVISDDDDNEVIEIIVDEDDDNKETIIVNGKRVNIAKGKKNIVVNGKRVNVAKGKKNIVVNGKKIKVVKGNKKNIWVTNVDHKDDAFVLEIDDTKKNIFISGDNGKSPLYIIDGKEVSKEAIVDLKSDFIESVTVLKDKSAIQKYGKKAKNGVIIIKTKKKN